MKILLCSEEVMNVSLNPEDVNNVSMFQGVQRNPWLSHNHGSNMGSLRRVMNFLWCSEGVEEMSRWPCGIIIATRCSKVSGTLSGFQESRTSYGVQMVSGLPHGVLKDLRMPHCDPYCQNVLVVLRYIYLHFTMYWPCVSDPFLSL